MGCPSNGIHFIPSVVPFPVNPQFSATSIHALLASFAPSRLGARISHSCSPSCLACSGHRCSKPGREFWSSMVVSREKKRVARESSFEHLWHLGSQRRFSWPSSLQQRFGRLSWSRLSVRWWSAAALSEKTVVWLPTQQGTPVPDSVFQNPSPGRPRRCNRARSAIAFCIWPLFAPANEKARFYGRSGVRRPTNAWHTDRCEGQRP